MANVQSGPLIFVDSAGELTASSTLVSYIVFTPNTALDSINLRGSATGPDILFLRAAVAKDTQIYDFSFKPLVFTNGIFIESITSGAKATIITTKAGA